MKSNVVKITPPLRIDPHVFALFSLTDSCRLPGCVEAAAIGRCATTPVARRLAVLVGEAHAAGVPIKKILDVLNSWAEPVASYGGGDCAEHVTRVQRDQHAVLKRAIEISELVVKGRLSAEARSEASTLLDWLDDHDMDQPMPACIVTLVPLALDIADGNQIVPSAEAGWSSATIILGAIESIVPADCLDLVLRDAAQYARGELFNIG